MTADLKRFIQPGRELRAVLLLLAKAPGPMYPDHLKSPKNPDGVSQPARYLAAAVRQGFATFERTVGGERYALTEAGRKLAEELEKNPGRGCTKAPSASKPAMASSAAGTPSPHSGRGPNPVRVDAPLRADAAPDNRNLYCTQYRECVNRAIRADWPAFSCLQCPLYTQAVRPKAEEFMRRDTSIHL